MLDDLSSGLIAVGASKMDPRKYIFWSLVITVPSSLIYLLIGCYFGAAYETIRPLPHLGYCFIAPAIIVLVIVLYLQRQFAEDFARKWGDE